MVTGNGISKRIAVNEIKVVNGDKVLVYMGHKSFGFS